jgi:maleylacetoacetate isomerase
MASKAGNRRGKRGPLSDWNLKSQGLPSMPQIDPIRHWIEQGMAGVERLLARYGRAPWALGAEPTLADCCLIPQIANTERMGCDLGAYPRSLAIYQHAIEHPAFDIARPARQPDYKA